MSVARAEVVPNLVHEHIHVPNYSTVHASKISLQACRESKTPSTVAYHSRVSNSSTKIPGEEGVMKIRLFAQRRGIMPRATSINGSHSVDGATSIGGAIVVSSFNNGEYVQMSIDFRLQIRSNPSYEILIREKEPHSRKWNIQYTYLINSVGTRDKWIDIVNSIGIEHPTIGIHQSLIDLNI